MLPVGHRVFKRRRKDNCLQNTLPFFNMRTLIFFLTFLFALPLAAQLSDDFSDGNLTDNPAWQGNPDHFIVNAAGQLQLNAPAAGSSRLWAPVLLPDSAVWEIFVEMDFAPSNLNRLRIYLQLDDPDPDNANGYFLEIGETGSQDALRFFRKNGASETLLATGTPGAVASEPAIFRLRVEKTAAGAWAFKTNYAGATPDDIEFEIFDDTFAGGNRFFLLECNYTASRTDKFFFDDLAIRPLLPDTQPPVLAGVEAVSETRLSVFFDEKLAPDAANPARFSVNNAIGNPLSVTPDPLSPGTLSLLFDQPFESLKTYTLTAADISDVAGNVAPTQSADFVFVKKEAPAPADLLINEIMADPSPAIGLPPFEYVEIYNRSAKIIDLAGLGFDSGGDPVPLPDFVLFPGEYVVLCDADHTAAFEPFGAVVGLSAFPALVNSGARLTLSDTSGAVIHAVEYSDEWFGGSAKKEGGWSLELVSPFRICRDDNNWRASENLAGGTPGVRNSVFRDDPDETPPTLDRAWMDATRPDEVWLFFSEKMNQASLADAGNYAFSGGLSLSGVVVPKKEDGVVLLTLSENPEPQKKYTVTVGGDVSDCLGNVIGTENSADFGLPEKAEPGDVVLNEILFNPRPGGSDFVELYNRSSKILEVGDWLIGNLQAGADTQLVAIETPFLFLPDTYLVLSESPANIRLNYEVSRPQWMLKNDMPAFNNDAGNVTLAGVAFPDPVVLDAFDYDENMHHPLLKDAEGVSLERIRPDLPTNASDNWHSAAETAGFATPTAQNSQFLELSPGEAPQVVWLPYQNFSPDGDGYRDFLSIQYTLDEPGFVGTVQVFDTSGRLVKDLARNVLMEVSGQFQWDGTTDESRLAPVGIYIVFMRIFSPSGDVRTFKKTCAIARRF
ncbi:MAG: hypothetical protein D6714_15280 [Bacteroidetes bacterium]|nr:MAG: hypothetical protein D6714_15280 [Bacteroidota bacterium]